MSRRITERVVAYRGHRAATAELTWAQRYMYDVVVSLRGQHAHLNFVSRMPVPDGTGIEDACTAIAALIARHEVLRTGFRTDPDGVPRQRVHAEGTLAVPVLDVATDAEADAVVSELHSADGFDDPERPVAARIETRDGAVTAVTLAVGHVAVDQGAMRLLERDFAGLVAGGALGDAVEQPVDRARWEAGPDGRRRNEAALRYAAEQLDGAAPTLYRRPRTQPCEPRYWIGELQSPAAGRSIRAVGRRLRVPLSAVVLGVFARLIAHDNDLPATTMLVIAGNRVGPDAAEYPGQLAQFAPVTVPAEPTFAASVRAAGRALALAYRHGQYDPVAFDQLLGDIGRRRGGELDLTTTLNFHTGDPGAVPVRRTAPDGPPTETTFRWKAKLPVENYKLYLDAGVDDALWLSLRIDTAVITPEAAEAFLRRMESLVLELADDEAPVAAIAAPAAGAGT
ncbi:condensation domain-containing protein [Dactylosporangium sp. CA-139114]|uniref:condensation domain-containing protein n=1 Tax=Dactylosporangium sp. CA-139114 TaxID=3239931 RepID=UPI003D9712D0